MCTRARVYVYNVYRIIYQSIKPCNLVTYHENDDEYEYDFGHALYDEFYFNIVNKHISPYPAKIIN